MIREEILKQFPELFGTKKVNGRDVNVEETIAHLTRELEPEIAAALTARRELLESPAPVRQKYAWPKWDRSFEDPVSGKPWTFRQIVQGLQKTAVANSPSVSSTEIWISLIAFILSYIVLGWADLVLMLRYSRRGMAEADAEVAAPSDEAGAVPALTY